MSRQRLCPKANVDKRQFKEETAVFKAMADPYRLRILATLGKSKHDVCVCDFTDAFPLKQPAVSHHLALLRDAGLIRGQRHGTWVYYRLCKEVRRQVVAALDAVVAEAISP